ncbi:MAG: hypothetical protein PHC61_10690 [Chitinivibrionales bacterium]|nr:hypothetical protein [Chitinivibrionales bacterium]
MHSLDWIVMTLPMIICLGIAFYSVRYIRSVADFMAGGRNAGRYLLCTARSQQGTGAVVFVAMFQQFASAGFTVNWWYSVLFPIQIIIATSGFVAYRYRQTRAMTLAQFFEMRYSRQFRIFAGGLAFFAGLLNFGIIPIVGARFMVYFMQLPPVMQVLGWGVPTHLMLMAIFLSLCVLTTTFGGQITVLLTDTSEGMFSQIFFVLIGIALFLTFFHWADTKAMLLDTKPGMSFVNPFDSFSLKDFNIWFVVIMIYFNITGIMVWQNSHAFNSSGATPHESRMGNIIGNWRGFAAGAMTTLLVACAMTYMHSEAGKAIVQDAMAKITDPGIRMQMEIPLALAHILPAGVKGMLLAICLMGIISGDGIHLHSWSSIFVQDVVMPLRKKPLSPKQHVSLLRWAIVGVALFAFIFGAFFPLIEFVSIWFMITGSLFSGAGAAIMGGLYWKRGTTAGAWTGLTVGLVLALSGICIRLYYQYVLGHEFFISGINVAFIANFCSLLSYVVVSLLTCKQAHNMDKLLHRGQYAVAEISEDKTYTRKINWYSRLIGIDKDFSRADRWVAGGIFSYQTIFAGIFVVGSLVYLVHPWSNAIWADYWFITGICLPMLIGIVTTVWFTIGCTRDMRVFFKRLKIEKIDAQDNGSVHHEEDDKVPELAATPK